MWIFDKKNTYGLVYSRTSKIFPQPQLLYHLSKMSKWVNSMNFWKKSKTCLPLTTIFLSTFLSSVAFDVVDFEGFEWKIFLCVFQSFFWHWTLQYTACLHGHHRTFFSTALQCEQFIFDCCCCCLFWVSKRDPKGGKTRKVAYYIFVVCTHHQLFHRLLMMNLLLSIERLWFWRLRFSLFSKVQFQLSWIILIK